MLPQRVSAVSFTVAGRQGVVFRGRSGRDLGSWNSHYPAVYQLGFSSLARPGSYRISVHAAGTTAVSPAFTIGSPAGLYQRDNFVSWPSVEPAIDYTANSLLAFAFAAQDNG